MFSYLVLLLVLALRSINQCAGGSDAGVQEYEESRALKYLEKAGYLDDLDRVRYRSHASEHVKQALREFQQYSGLPVTGRLDEATVTQMKKPRCGIPDVIKPSQRPKDQKDIPLPYVTKRSIKWPKNDLTYKFNSYSSKLTQSSQRSVIASALKMWSDVTPLHFKRHDYGTVDIDIAFGSGDHGCGSPFDGPGGVLAHAYFPGPNAISGDAHFDSDENWVAKGGEGFSLESVAAHEFGHSLGLGHSSDRTALMYAFYGENQEKLHQDDIFRIQDLYGPNPNETKPTSRPMDDEMCKLVFDDIIQVKTGEIYAFAGDYIYTMAHGGMSNPRLIRDVYAGAPSSPGAVVFDKGYDKTFFFKGAQMWRYTGFKLDQGYPKTLPVDFHNASAAIISWTGNVNVYLFQGNSYTMWDESFPDGAHGGYPKKVQSRWLSAPYNIGASFEHRAGYEYLFQGQQYWRYHKGKGKDYDFRSPGYPKSILPYWLGCGTYPADGNEYLV